MDCKHFAFVFLLLFPLAMWGQSTFTVSGFIQDKDTKEPLIEAYVYVKDDTSIGTSSDIDGSFTLSLVQGTYTLVASYLGYTDEEVTLTVNENQQINIALSEGVAIQEVVVTADAPDENVQSTNMGRVDLNIKEIKNMPMLLGEVDIFKAMQLLPGVQSSGEGNSGFYVRGGGADQNLVLLDDAVVYNTGHLLGFFSVFNPEAVDNMTLYKGSMPAQYGGRLSSVVDVAAKNADDEAYKIEGGIGLISSRITVQGPIKKHKGGLLLAARRTYAFDLAQPAINKTDAAGTNYFFYDFNGKFHYKLSDKDRIYWTGYHGKDVLKYNSKVRGFNLRLPYGNTTSTLRWSHLFNDKLSLNTSLIYNQYEFQVGFAQETFSAKVFSGVKDWNGKIDLDYLPHPNHEIKTGIHYTYHTLTPQQLTASSSETEFEINPELKFGHQLGVYAQDDWTISDKWKANIGLRLSSFIRMGPYTSPLTQEEFAGKDVVKTYVGFEPRASVKYAISDESSIKAGFSQTYQYVHLVSSSTSTIPSDIWVPSSDKIRPQQARQYSLGYFRNFKDNQYEASVEAYYKNMNRQIDYQENFVNDPTENVEDNFVFGKGTSYGMEFFLNKKRGNLTGWIGYTLAKTDRQFPDINDGNPFPTTYDRRHDLSIVANYKLNDRWKFGTVFVYATGNAYTAVKSFYFVEGNFVPKYGTRNKARIDDYHRWDISATYTPKKRTANQKWEQNWSCSIYNVYNRKNVFFVYYIPKTDTETQSVSIQAYKVSLFPVIPSISWNFKF